MLSIIDLNMVSANRIQWIDQYRAILFMFVTMVHTDRSPFWLRSCYDFFYLPGFFFLSGFLFKEKTYIESLKGIINSLLIPLLIYYFLLSLISFISNGDYNLFINGIWKKILTGDVWFIPCLIFVELIFFSFYYLVYRKWSFCILFLLLFSIGSYFFFEKLSPSHYPWNIDTACWCLMYYILGTLYKKNPLSINKKTSYIVFVTYCILSLYLSYYGVAGGGTIDIHNNFVVNPWSYLLLSVFGTLSSFWVANYLPINKYLCNFGQFTLFAFPFHVIIIKKLEKLWLYLKIDEFVPANYSSIMFVTVSLISVYATLYCVCSLLMRYVPVLLGKSKILK